MSVLELVSTFRLTCSTEEKERSRPIYYRGAEASVNHGLIGSPERRPVVVGSDCVGCPLCE